MPIGKTVIITEKPDAMKKIANALSNGKAKKIEKRNGFWFEFTYGKEKIIVGCAVGHLFGLDTIKDGSGWKYPTFNVEWIPSHTKKGHEFSKKYYENMEEIVKKGKKFIIATDYDTEGSVIGYNILKILCGKEDAKRMKFSTMTKDELINSYENMEKHIDSNQIESGLTRHYLDFFWGINLTRALTIAIKNSDKKGFAILSTGRVQGPTLAMLYEKEQEIKKFNSKKFWEIESNLKIGKLNFTAPFEKSKIWNKNEVDKILVKLKSKNGIVKSIKKREYKQKPPIPFNTTELQSECYSQYKYSPTQTLSIAESLYQKGYISYPRSSSQKLPSNINYKKIIRSLGNLKSYTKFAQDILGKEVLIPNEGKKIDPAHPAVYPTFEIPNPKNLTSQQKKIYDLIVRRFLSVFGSNSIRESNTIKIDINGNIFNLVGKRTLISGWTEYYKPYMSTEEIILPKIEIGNKIKVNKIKSTQKNTQPPPRYNQGSILKEMESRNLGTKATRAEILRTLYSRRYILGQSIKMTKLGESVVIALNSYAPKIISEDLTKKMEMETEKILEGKLSKETVIRRAKKTLIDILKDFKKNEKKIGNKLIEGLLDAREEENKMGECVVCKDGQMKILRSRFSGKFFVGCSNYFRCKKCHFTRKACKCKCKICKDIKGKCKCSWKDKIWNPTCQTGYPLPGHARNMATGKKCNKCSTMIINVIRAGKRPFRMCLDPKCETKKDWGKKKKNTNKTKKKI